MQKFTSLDAFRGGAALGVAIYHWAVFTTGADGLLIGGFYLFIDFFFVLSGFIIAAIYRDQICDGASAARFLLLRLARIYPAHVCMLAAFLAVATISALLDGAGPPDGRLSAEGFVGHLLLIQPLDGAASWNQPAWTISVEMQLCVLFAFLCLSGVLHSALGRVSLAAAIAATLFYLTTQYDDLNIVGGDALGRGFVAFATGVLVHSVTMTRWAAGALTGAKRRLGAGAEITALAAAAAFLALAEGGSAFAAPFVFAALIFVFLDEQGGLSRALRQPAFQRLGALSYSIYMAHFLFIAPMQALFAGGPAGPLAAAVGLAAYLALTLGFAFCLHRLIERPTREAMRVWVDRRMPSKPAPVRAPSAMTSPPPGR